MSKQLSGYSLDRDTGELRGPLQIGSVPLPKFFERPLSVSESLFGKSGDDLNVENLMKILPPVPGPDKKNWQNRPKNFLHDISCYCPECASDRMDALSEKVLIKYLYGPLDGLEVYHSKEDIPQAPVTSTICEDKGNGHIFYPLNNEYAIYFPDPDDPELMVFFGLEWREIDLYKGKDCIVNREWRATR